jgi:archaemetzincin
MAGRFCLIVLFAAAFVPANPVIVTEDPRPVVAIQPMAEVDPLSNPKIRAGIEGFFPVRVAVQPATDLPPDAFYKPNQRYRAEQLLTFLDSLCAERGNEFLKMIGITSVDISTTKGEVFDWGIFGLGYMPGRVCIVSTFRLGRKKAGEIKFFERLVKVVNHELGHNFGLDHCPVPGCLMEDAKGTVKTVDRETGELCPDCQARLKLSLR